ncbi:hypothetical protein HW555_003319, partial [Spodoptera exigua]
MQIVFGHQVHRAFSPFIHLSSISTTCPVRSVLYQEPSFRDIKTHESYLVEATTAARLHSSKESGDPFVSSRKAYQEKIAVAIETLFTNFKKDGRERKTPDYIKRRLDSLDQYWSQFNNNHITLVNVGDASLHYFSSERETIKNYLLPKSTGSEERPQTPILKPPSFVLPSAQEQDRASSSKTEDMLKKQLSNFKAYMRTVSSINVELVSEKWEFEDLLRTLQSRWSVIDKLHWELDSELSGSNSEYEQEFSKYEAHYNNIKKTINKKMWSVAHIEKTTPKMDIPIFTGSYSQWIPFKDLFTETIHRNPSLSNAQKLQFLKGKLRGEPERLIQHLQISSSNYSLSWAILTNRYDNTRLIFTAHANTLLNVPNLQQQSANGIKRIHDVTNECLNAIKNLDINTESWDPILVLILSQKLDTDTYQDYMESVKQPRAIPNLKEFLKFLETKFTTLESSRRKQDNITQKSSSSDQHQATGKNSNKPHQKLNYYKTSFSSSARVFPSNSMGNKNMKNFTPNKYWCFICQNNEHGIYFCQKFLEMPPHIKKNVVDKNNLCYNCLHNHYGQPCKSEKRCRECNKEHNSILHEAFQSNHMSTRRTRPEASSSTATTEQQASSQVQGSSHVSLQGDPIEVEAPDVLEESFYMDDLLHGSHSIESAKQMQEDLIKLLKAGGFNLRKWKANSSALLDEVICDQENFDFKQKCKQVNVAMIDNTFITDLINDLLMKYSSMNKAIRIFAWINRIVCRKSTNYLSVDELTQSRNIIVKVNQASAFHDEINCLQRDFQQKIPHSKTKPSSFTKVAMSLLLFLMAIAPSSQTVYNITSLQNNNSIYFDSITNMHLIRDNWRLVVYYDTTPYQEGNTTLQKYIDYLEKICPLIKMESHCKAIILQLRHGLRNIQVTLLDTITNIYNGRFNFQLLRPEQLRHELNIISGQLPRDLSSPIDSFNLAEVYNLLQIRTRMSPKYLIIEIKIPLIGRDMYEIYRLILIPYLKGNQTTTVVPISEYAAINLKKDALISISESDLKQCTRQNINLSLCYLRKPIYHIKDDQNLCERLAGTRMCKSTTSSCGNMWREINKLNEYFYFCCEQCHMKLLCGDQITAVQLTGSGLLSVNAGCIIKSEDFLVFAHRSGTSKIMISSEIEAPRIAPINHIINVSIPTSVQLDSTTHSDKQLQEIRAQIDIMKDNTPIIQTVSTHDAHHYAAIYIIIGVMLLTAIIYVMKRVRVRRQQTLQQAAAEASQEQSLPVATTAAAGLQTVSYKVDNQCSKCASVVQCSEKAGARIIKQNSSTSPILRSIVFGHQVHRAFSPFIHLSSISTQESRGRRSDGQRGLAPRAQLGAVVGQHAAGRQRHAGQVERRRRVAQRQQRRQHHGRALGRRRHGVRQRRHARQHAERRHGLQPRQRA